MISSLFQSIFYNPLYNGLVFLIDILPAHNVAWAVILLTVIVMTILFPLSKASVRTQIKMKMLEGEMNKIKEQYKDQQKQAEAMMAFYKKNNLNPFATLFMAILQIPIILAMYYIFYKGGLPVVDTTLLYSFVAVPTMVNMGFFGLTISQPAIILGFFAAISQFFQAQYSVPPFVPSKNLDGKKSFKDDFAKSMNMQIKYVIPFFIFIFSFKVSGAVALYWTTKSLFMIGQELVIRHTVRKPLERAALKVN